MYMWCLQISADKPVLRRLLKSRITAAMPCTMTLAPAAEPVVAPGQPKPLCSQQVLARPECTSQVYVYLQCLLLRQRPSRWRGRQRLCALPGECCSGWRLLLSLPPHQGSPWLWTMHL